MPALQVTIRIGDAAPGPSIESLIHDLNHTAHHEASKHYGRDLGCQYLGYSREGGDGDRAAFEAQMRRMNVAEHWIAHHLGEFDRAERPVAVIHWWVLEGGIN